MEKCQTAPIINNNVCNEKYYFYMKFYKDFTIGQWRMKTYMLLMLLFLMIRMNNQQRM